MPKVIILRDDSDEVVLSKIFDAALKAQGAEMYHAIRHIDSLTKVVPDVTKENAEEAKPAESNENKPEEIALAKPAEKPKKKK